MSFNTSYIVNDSLTVSGLNGVKNFNESAGNRALEVQDELIILEKTTPSTIDYMEWRTSDRERVVVIFEHLVNGVWEGYTNILINTSGNAYTKEIHPRLILEESSNQFVLLQYDTVEGLFKVATKDTFYFSEGFRITVKNKSTVNQNSVGYIIRGREQL